MSSASIRTLQIFDEYEKRFAKARFEKELTIPTTPEDKEKILEGVKKMLCFDEKYLKAVGMLPTDIAGYIHDAGQPTSHFNVLKE